MNKQLFSVRCVFEWQPQTDMNKAHLYEERITIWDAADINQAIEMATAEAKLYSESTSCTDLGLTQAYHMFDEANVSNIEVFSLLRESDLPPNEYIKSFFHTGNEHQR